MEIDKTVAAYNCTQSVNYKKTLKCHPLDYVHAVLNDCKFSQALAIIAEKNTVRLVCSVALVKRVMVPIRDTSVAKIVGRWSQSMNYNATLGIYGFSGHEHFRPRLTVLILAFHLQISLLAIIAKQV